MQVKMEMNDVTITLGNKGVVLKISDNSGKHVGDLRIGKATVEWMKGRTRDGNGVRVKMSELIDWFESA
jgi:hypothetical protein